MMATNPSDGATEDAEASVADQKVVVSSNGSLPVRCLPEEKRADYEDILGFWGKFGKVQMLYCFLLCFPTALDGYLTMSYAFVGYNLKYRCAVPHCEQTGNASYFWDPENRKYADYVEAAIPPEALEKSFKCTYRAVAEEPAVTSCSEYLEALSRPEAEVSIRTCHASQLVFDKSVVKTSAVQDFRLTCDRNHLNELVGSIYMMGGLLMSPLIGALSDAWGRGKAMQLCILGAMGCTWAKLNTGDPLVFALVRILQGGFTLNMYPVAFVMAVEHVSMDHSATVGVILGFSYGLGQVILGFEALLTQGDWRTIQRAAMVTCFFLMALIWIVPDSPRWFLSKSRLADAKAAILRIAQLNKSHVPPELLDNVVAAEGSDNNNVDASVEGPEAIDELNMAELRAAPDGQLVPRAQERLTIRDIWRSKAMLLRTLNVGYQWFAISICYLGLTFISPSLKGSAYTNFILNCVVEIPGVLVYLPLAVRYGRRSLILWCMLFCGVSCVACALSMGLMSESEDSTYYGEIFEVTFNVVGKFFISVCYSLIFNYTSELYPTELRNTALGIANCFACMGEMGGFFNGELGKAWPPLPLILYGVIAWVSAILMIFLPETLGCPLPETIQEAIDIGKQRSKPK